MIYYGLGSQCRFNAFPYRAARTVIVFMMPQEVEYVRPTECVCGVRTIDDRSVYTTAHFSQFVALQQEVQRAAMLTSSAV